MAVTKAKKIEQVKQLAGELKSIKNGFVAEFGKLTVANDDELRKGDSWYRRKVPRRQEHARRARGAGHGF